MNMQLHSVVFIIGTMLIVRTVGSGGAISSSSSSSLSCVNGKCTSQQGGSQISKTCVNGVCTVNIQNGDSPQNHFVSVEKSGSGGVLGGVSSSSHSSTSCVGDNCVVQHDGSQVTQSCVNGVCTTTVGNNDVPPKTLADFTPAHIPQPQFLPPDFAYSRPRFDAFGQRDDIFHNPFRPSLGQDLFRRDDLFRHDPFFGGLFF